MSIDPALYELSVRYASAADRRDVAGFVGVFAADGRLTVLPAGGGEPAVRTGHEELAGVPAALARYDRTFHLVGQAAYDHEGDRATGEVYCVAHHLRVGAAGAEDRVLYIRYADEYRAEAPGSWRIAHRQVQVDWTETRPVDQPVGS